MTSRAPLTLLLCVLPLGGCDEQAGNDPVGDSPTGKADAYDDQCDEERGVTPLSNGDVADAVALINERLYPNFAGGPGARQRLEGALTPDARLRWIMLEADGRDAFIDVILDAADEEIERFAVAVNNYKFLATECGVSDDAQRPLGLPPSIDITTFDPAAITPDLLEQHPGLLAPRFTLEGDLIGQDAAAGRFVRVARFAHSWMTDADDAYLFIDRFVVVKVDGQLQVDEYEFNVTLSDIPAPPEPLEACPE